MSREHKPVILNILDEILEGKMDDLGASEEAAVRAG